MRKILIILMMYASGLTASSCNITTTDPNAQLAFSLCVAMFMNNPAIALEGVSAYQASAPVTSQATTSCTWCQKMIQGSNNNSGGMTNNYYDPYDSGYNDLTQINYESLQSILQAAGAFDFVNQGPDQKEAFVNCFVNQCGVRQVPGTNQVTQCAQQCTVLAQQYLTWIAQQSLSAPALANFKTSATALGCWNNGSYGMGCFAGCLDQQKMYQATVMPWILTQ